MSTRSWLSAVNDGHRLVITWMPSTTSGLNWSAILAGSWDTYIQTQINYLTDYYPADADIIIRLAPDMNGDWYPWSPGYTGGTVRCTSPQQYVDTWKHIVDVVRAINPNIKFWWCPNVNDSGKTVVRTTGTGQGGLYTFTVASATGIQVGDVAYETDSLGNGISETSNRIGPDARVQQINGTTITVDVPNDGSFTNAYVAFARITYPMEAFYPYGNDSQGRPYVDIVGYDSYNSLVGTFKTALDTVKGVTYVTHPVQASAYDRVTALDSAPEVWIGEFGCEDYLDPDTTSHPPANCKANFYTDLFAIDKYASGLSRLGAIVFYDRVPNTYLDGSALPIAYGNTDLGSRQWHHDTSPGAWAAFVSPTTGFLQTASPSTLVPNGDFEQGVGNWYDSGPFFGGVAATLTTSTTVKHGGTQALQVTYANSSVAPLPGEWISGLVEGRLYTLSGWVRVPAGSPPVKMDGLFLPGAQSAFSTTNDNWEYLTVSFVYSTPSGATPGDLWIGANPASDTVASSVAGQGFYLDDVTVFPGALITDSIGVTDAGQQVIATPSSGGTAWTVDVADDYLTDERTTRSQQVATAALSVGASSTATVSSANIWTATAALAVGAALTANTGQIHSLSTANSEGTTDTGQRIVAALAGGGTDYRQTLTEPSYLTDPRSVGHGVPAALVAGADVAVTGTISSTGNAWHRTVTNEMGSPVGTDSVTRGPNLVVTDDMGVDDDGGTPVKTTTGGSQTRDVTDDMGLTEPDFMDLVYGEIQTDDEGITHPVPDRSLSNTGLKSAEVIDALSFTDEATWEKFVQNVIPITITDSISLTPDTALPVRGVSTTITVTDSEGITHPTVDRVLGTSTAWTRTIADALSLTDSAYAYRPDQVGLHLEIKSVDPATGAVRGPLPDHSDLTLSPIFCDVGSVQFKYLRDGINAQWVAVDEEFAVFLNDQEIGDLRFIVDEFVDNDATEDEWMTLAGRTTLALLEQAVVYPGGWPTVTDPPRHDFTAATPGFILKTLVDRAQARGSITEISTATFDATVDSNGVAWVTTQGQPLAVTVSFDAGTDYLKVVQALVDMGAIEVRMAGRELIVLNPGTLMVDRTAQARPLVFRTGVSVVDSPRKESTRDLRTALLVAGADNTYVEVKDDTAVAVFGRREGYENQGGINDPGTLTSYGQTKLTGTADVKFEKTHGLTFADSATPRPWFDFRLGDWVYSDYGTGSLERLRIRQWTIKEEASGILTGTVSLNDLFAEKIERLSRELNKIVSGATVVGGSEPPPDTGTGDIMPPGVPQNVVFASSTYTDPSGIVLAQITLNWTAVTTNADGSAAADIDHYEVGLSYTGPVNFTTVGQSLTNVFYYSPVRPGSQVWIQVRAVDTSGNPGGWAPWITGTIQSDGQPPPVPHAPTVAPYLGQLKITWDGLGTGGVTMPIDFKYAEVWYSLISSTGMTDANWLVEAHLLDTLSASGSTIVTDLAYGVPVYVRLRTVDTSNNRSAFGPQGSGTPELIISTDMGDIENASITTTFLDDFNAYDARWTRIAGVASQSIVDLTDGLTGGSALAVAGDGTYEWGQNIAFDPDVLYRVKARVRSIGGSATGKQYIAAGTYGSFETETTGWGPFAGQSSTIVRSTARAYNITGWPTSTASALITWAADNDMIGATVSNLVVGHTYTFSAPVFVTTGSAAVRLAIFMNSTSAASTTTNAWQRLTLTFTATATTHWVAVQHVPPTGGAAIDLQASFETGVDGFYTSVVGSGGGSAADLTMDLAADGATPTGWTPYPFGTLPSATGTTTSVSVNWQTTKTYFHSGTGSVRVTGYSSGTSLGSTPFAVMRTTDPYSVTPGQAVTMGASFALVAASQYGGQCWMGIATSATSTPPAATQNVWDIAFSSTNPAWQGWYLSPSIGGGSALQWVNGNNSAHTFTIPAGHTYAWLWVAVQFGANDGTPQSYDYLVDDVVFSAATSVTPPTLAFSTDRAYTTSAGTHSLKVTWNGTGQDASRDVSLSTGVAHCASAYVYVPAGSPAVTIKSLRTTSTGSVVTTTGQSTSTTGSWQRIYVTDTPQSGDTAQRIVFVNGTGTGTAYVDAFQVEQGTTPTAWTGLATQTLGQVYVDDAMVEDGPTATVFTTLMAGTGRLVTVGLMGVASDGTTRVSPTGTSAATITPIAASNRDPGDSTWTTYEGFVKGSAVAGSLDDTLSRDAATPGAMQSSTRYVRPAFAVNQTDGSGTTQVDMMTVEVLAFPSNVIQDFMVANMSAGKITAGAIRAVLIIADSQGKILAGDPLGARVEMNQHGLFAYTASGDQEFILNADDGSATFSGTLQGSTFRTALPPYPRIELSGDFAQRIDCYPDMNAWIDPPGFRTGVGGSVVDMFGGQNATGTGARISVSMPSVSYVDPWYGGSGGSGSQIVMTSGEVQVSGHVLVGSWIDKIYNGYVRARVSLSSGLAHGVTSPGPYDTPPYNDLEIRATPIKDTYLIKGTFSIYGGYLGDGTTLGFLPTGFPAPARTQIVAAYCNWTVNRTWIEISTAGYLYLHGLSSGVSVNGYSVRVHGMYDTY